MNWATNNLTFRLEWQPEYLWGAVLFAVLILVLALISWLQKRYDDDWIP